MPTEKTPNLTYRSCNLCEAVCGLVIEHDDSEVISIKGDKEDPLSRGHLCPKAIALQDIHADPDRLRRPMKRKGDEFEEISWEEAFDLVETKLGAIRREHGDDSVALYLGNPTVHNSGALLFQKFLKQSLNTRHSFAATSVDQLPHHIAASLMFGHGFLIPIPDIDRTQHMLILGANPAASNGSLMTAPGVRDRIRAIRDRGGKVILVDPRVTETVRIVDQHHLVRPGTDVYLLAAMVNIILSEDLGTVPRDHVKNIDILREAVSPFSPELAEQECGIAAAEIREMAVEFASAESAVAYGRMGVSTQPHGGLCHWLINALNLVTGNLDQPGGHMFSNPAVPITFGGGEQEFARWHSRVRKLPEFEGDLPVSVLAEEMLTPGKGQIRALITNAGNPVLSTPNGTQLEKGIDGLEFYVALDIYINETTRHADLILPSPTGLENNHYDFVFNALSVRNVSKYSPRVFEPESGSLNDWEIMKELSLRLLPKNGGIRNTLKRKLLNWSTPDRLLNIGLASGPYGAWRRPFTKGLNLKRLRQSPHGIDFGPLEPRLPGALKTSDGKIDAAPSVYVEEIRTLTGGEKASDCAPLPEGTGSFRLIGRRHLRSNNSWMHNSERLMKGADRCTLIMHSDDAAGLGFENGAAVTVSSDVGKIELPLEITDEIMTGVVSIPHGFGHHRKGTALSVAQKNPGASINDITDDKCVDPLTGNAAFSGQKVLVSAS
ncbi:molybdopterin-dependent oxidoreductase [Verrucomicrobiales bacterium]|nr:molybdopterin-dependent oxidoreductase [Verrucomicrobiales bacterium]